MKLLLYCIIALAASVAFGATQTNKAIQFLLLQGNASGGSTNSFTNLNSVVTSNNVTAGKSFTLNGVTITNLSFGTDSTNYTDTATNTLWISTTNLVTGATNTQWIATTNLVTTATNAIYITSTNAAIQAILALNYVTASVTNGLASLAYVDSATNGLWITSTNYIAGLNYVTASVTNGLASLAYVDSATNTLWVATTNAIAGSTPSGVAYLAGTNVFTGTSNTFTGTVRGYDSFRVSTSLSSTTGATAFAAGWPGAPVSPLLVRWNPTNTLGNVGYIVSAQGFRATDTNGVWQWELSTMPVTNVSGGNVVVGSVSNGVLTIDDSAIASVAILTNANTFTQPQTFNGPSNTLGGTVYLTNVVTTVVTNGWIEVSGSYVSSYSWNEMESRNEISGTGFPSWLQALTVMFYPGLVATNVTYVDASTLYGAENHSSAAAGNSLYVWGAITNITTNVASIVFGADGSGGTQTVAFLNTPSQLVGLGSILGVQYGAGTGTSTNAGVVTLGTNALVNTNSSLQGLINGLSERDPVLTLGVDSTGVFANITTSPAGNLEYWFGNSLISYGTSQFVRLTAGTTNTPSLNYICAMADGTVSNYTEYPYFPDSANTRAFMFEVFLMDTNSVAAGTGYALRSWTENVGTRRGLGRVSWIGERVRRLPAIWESGVMASCSSTNVSTNDCYVTTTSGVGWQMHSHTIPANTNRTPLWVINHAAGFQTATNLQQIVSDANGAAILAGNGDCFAVNLMAFVESGITPKSTRLMLALSTDDYTVGTAAVKLANCIADSSSYDVTGVPVWMQGMTIRLARIVIRRDSATARTYWVYDRRGQPLGTAGGGSSSSGESDPIYEADLNNGLIVTNYSSGVITLAGATVIIDFNVAKTNWAFSLPLTNAQTTLVLSNFPVTPIRTGLSIASTCGVTGTLVIPADLKFIGTASPITNYIAGTNYSIAIETVATNKAVIVVAPERP